MDIKTDELVLKVTEDIDPKKLDLDKYDDFLEELCGHREFQKEAIRAAIRFLLGGEYKNTEDLARKNYDKNPLLREYYVTFENLRDKLEFPNKLACTIDLATATGKSWVIYGIAQILLCENAVDRVLIIVPTLTIEKQLKQYTTKGHNILVCAMGTTGTIMGCSKYLKPKGWEIVGVQPLPNCKIEGLKNLDIQRRPKIYDEKAINWMHQVTDKDAWDCVKELCKEGIFGGFSSGAAFHIAKQWWKFYKLWSPNNYVNIVVIIHDTIRNYL